MHVVLPVSLDPRKCASKRERFKGSFGASNLTQLDASVSAILAPVSAELRFNLDEAGDCIVRGIVSTLVEVVCQRCLDPLQLSLRAKLSLQVVASEDQIDHLPPDYDSWLVTGKIANLYELLEEELLLALPIVNCHALGDCTGDAFVKGQTDNNLSMVSDSPFNILKQLKK